MMPWREYVTKLESRHGRTWRMFGNLILMIESKLEDSERIEIESSESRTKINSPLFVKEMSLTYLKCCENVIKAKSSLRR